jgi:hypothetical protein
MYCTLPGKLDACGFGDLVSSIRVTAELTKVFWYFVKNNDGVLAYT